MSLMLIDDQGETWDGQSRYLRAAFDSPYSGGEFSSYAVTNLGFVAIHTYGTSCQVRLRPSIVTESAQRALRDWLAKARVDRVVLSTLDQDWTDELIRSAPAALERMAMLVHLARRTRLRDFLARTVDAQSLPENTALGQVARNWPHFLRPNGQHELLRLIEEAFGDRYVVVKREPTRGRIVFHQFGGGLYSKYETWRTCAVGAPVEEQPDRAYGRWIAGTYNDAIASFEPRIEDIDAVVRWPDSGRVRLRYRRLIAPIPQPVNEPMLLAASLIDNRIDLRVASG